MRVLAYTVPAECDGMLLRAFARHRLGFSAAVLTQLKTQPGAIAVNGESCFVTRSLRAGDRVRFSLPEERPFYEAVPLPLSVLWESEDYLAVDKPPAMPIHPSPGHDRDSLLNAAAWFFEQKGAPCRFRPLYRLDRDTSGIVMLAKHRVAALAHVEKIYFAVCEGTLSGAGTIDLPIGLEPGSKIKRCCGAGERAVTHWQALRSQKGRTLLACRLETGRTHQIRVHLSTLGHPLCGDELYGGSRESISRQALHCWALRLQSQALGEDRSLLSPFPNDWTAAFPWLPTIEICKKETTLCLPV